MRTLEQRPHAIDLSEGGRTKQSFKDECNINFMLKTYQSGGKPPAVNHFPARYGDFSQSRDLHSALNQVREAETAFDALPAEVRKRFGNDPGELLDFMSDAENAAEAAKLGLIDAEPPDQVDDDQVEPEAAKADPENEGEPPQSS